MAAGCGVAGCHCNLRVKFIGQTEVEEIELQFVSQSDDRNTI
jgi:hypothetical protein